MGTAITFLTNEDDEVMYDLKQGTEIDNEIVWAVTDELYRN